MFNESKYGSSKMDDYLKELRTSIIDGCDVTNELDELIETIDLFKQRYSNLSESEALLEQFKVSLAPYINYSADDEFVEGITLDTKFEVICTELEIGGFELSNLIDAINENTGEFDTDNRMGMDYGTWTYTKGITVGEILGIAKEEVKEELSHEIDKNTVNFLLQNITDAAHEASSIERYNLFHAIEKHMAGLRKAYAEKNHK